MWITNSVLVRGRGHIAEEKPCQDRVYTIEQDGVSVISLADGAGSRARSEIGAEIASKTAGNFILQHKDELYQAETFRTLKEELYQDLINALQKGVEENNCESIRDLASTLLCVGIYRDRLFMIHVGDGVIIYRKGGQLLILSEPDNGEYANVTTFVTSQNAFEHLRFKRAEIPEEADAFFIMSDGSAMSLYNPQEKRASNALNLFADTSREYSQEVIHEELLDFFEESIRKRTLDDCSMCMMVRLPNDGPIPEVPLSKNQQKIFQYVMEHGAISFRKLANVLYRRRHLKNFRRDIIYLADNGCIRFENEIIYPV